MENETTRAYIEVKCIDKIDDVQWFVTPRKLAHIKKTIQYHLRKSPTEKELRVDVVFIRWW
jgi:Holliday junction resolvase-like predicted endonuclease